MQLEPLDPPVSEVLSGPTAYRHSCVGCLYVSGDFQWVSALLYGRSFGWGNPYVLWMVADLG